MSMLKSAIAVAGPSRLLSVVAVCPSCQRLRLSVPRCSMKARMTDVAVNTPGTCRPFHASAAICKPSVESTGDTSRPILTSPAVGSAGIDPTGSCRRFRTSAAAGKILSDPENKGQHQRGVNFDTLGSWNNRLSLSILMEESIKKGKLIPKIPLEEVGTASLIGRRKMNEDRIVVKELENNLLYFGIFDGHASSFAADYVVENLEHHIQYLLTQTDELDKVLHRAFVEIHNVLARHLTHYFMDTEVYPTGTTATVCLIRDSSDMVVANVGDSRAVLCRKGKALRLSHDDDPDDPSESVRVTEHGGKIVQNSQGISQVNGRLGMTRSLGDTELKAFGVIPQPHLRKIEIKHGNDAFMMLATDGLCFVLSDEEMVNIISSCQTPTEAAGLVADQALHFGSEDNSSVIVVPFGAWGKYISSASSLQYRFGRNMFSKRD